MSASLPLKPLTHRGEVLRSTLDNEWRRTHDVQTLLDKRGDDMREHAVFVAEHGVSHRKSALQVGAVAIGLVAHANYNPNRPLRRTGIIVVEGYNYSPYKGAPKDCAEQRALRMGDETVEQAIRRGELRLFSDPLRAWEATLLFVASNAKPHTNLEVNNLPSLTLDPCATPCQGFLRDHPAASSNLRIEALTFDTKRDIIATDAYSLAELMDRYAHIAAPLVSRELQSLAE